MTRLESSENALGLDFEGLPSRTAIAMMVALIGLVMMVPFMIAALAVDIRTSIALSDRTLGAAVSSYFLASAIASRPGGWYAERDGGTTSLVVASGLCVAALLGLSAPFSTAAPLFVWSVVGGVANALAHVSVNTLFTRRVRPGRRGLAFGVKQAAVPFGGMIAGFSLPVGRLIGGWQRIFFVAAIAGSVLCLWSIREARRHRLRAASGGGHRQRELRLRSPHVLVLIALGAGCGVASTTILATFVVVGSVAGRVSATAASLTLAAASLLAVVGRTGLGWFVDRRVSMSRTTATLPILVVILGTSCLAFLVIDSQRPVLYVVGAMIALAFGWGWHGLIDYSVVRLYPAGPGRATGVSQIGAYLGGILGPLIAGLIAEVGDYDAVWILGAALTALAAIMFVGAAIAVRRDPHMPGF